MNRIVVLIFVSLFVAGCQSSPAPEALAPTREASIPAPSTESPAPEQDMEPEPSEEEASSPVAEAENEAATGPRYAIRDQTKIIECGADPTAIQIDGGIRVYHAPTGLSCPDIEDSDSVVVPPGGGEAVEDEGFRFDPGGYAGPHKRIYRLPDGTYRMYFHTPFDAAKQGIGSAVSADGLNFTKEPGLRISSKDAGFDAEVPISPGDILPTIDGRYRMYFSSLSHVTSGGLTFETVKSAVSDDLLTWTVEEGERLGGSSQISGGEHPSAIANPDGSVTLFYGRNINFALFYSTSPDGLNFEKEERLMGATLDSVFLPQPDGTLIGFIGQRDNATGISSIDRVVLEPVTD